MSDDSLRDLLGAGRRRKTQEEPKVSDEDKTEPSKGLNPLDVLNMPEDQRDVVNWLSRRQQARMAEIQEGVEGDPAKIREIVNALKQAGAIHEALVNGEVFYRVVYRAKVGRVSRGLPQDFWSRLDLDNISFLKRIGLFHGMSEDQLKIIADKLESRTYQRNEIIMWQGEVSDHLFFIKSGIVGVSRLSPKSRETEVIAYLREGDMLGEYSLLSEQNTAAAATAKAMSEVVVLIMRRNDFYDLLHNHGTVAIALSRLLAQRIIESNRQLSRSADDTKLSVILRTEPDSGATALGIAIASTLAQRTEKPSAYTEYPYSASLSQEFNFPTGQEIFQHPGGCDVFVYQDTLTVPSNVQVTLFLDELIRNYANVVIVVEMDVEDSLNYILERTDQVIIVTPPTEGAWHKVEKLHEQLQKRIHPEKTGVSIIVNHRFAEYTAAKASFYADFEIPHVVGMPTLGQEKHSNLPEAFAKVAGTLADRLGRNNQISIYIPTTTDVDQAIDTSTYVDETLAFLGKRFGGATSSQAHGVWNSEEVGLVSEIVHIVRSYITQADLDRYLPDIMEYMEQLKQTLKQEAMAVEINQKLILI